MDYNFFKKINVVNSSFGDGIENDDSYDMIIQFTTQGVFMINEGTGVVEYSFNGVDVHGELNSATVTAGLAFDVRVISKIWFRVKTGSSGPITVSVQAWGTM